MDEREVNEENSGQAHTAQMNIGRMDRYGRNGCRIQILEFLFSIRFILIRHWISF